MRARILQLMVLAALASISPAFAQTLTPGPDTFSGTAGPDIVVGLAGNDTILGLAGDDNIRGNAGDDRIEGGPGIDWLRGGAGDDTILGGGSTDRLAGGNGDDRLFGGGGQDAVMGGKGNDVLNGGEHSDEMAGGPGDDVLYMGPGRDFLSGDGGADRFVLEDWAHSGPDAAQADVIMNFRPGQGDRIDLSAIDPIPGGIDDAFTDIDYITPYAHGPTELGGIMNGGEVHLIRVNGGQPVMWIRVQTMAPTITMGDIIP